VWHSDTLHDLVQTAILEVLQEIQSMIYGQESK
jgi:hypothetical protein